MDDRIKESISALMDGEANELELQRLLSQVDQDEMMDVWRRYHGIRDAINAERGGHYQIDVSQAVSAAIESEQHSALPAETSSAPNTLASDLNDSDVPLSMNASGNEKNYSRIGGLFALAASVSFALFLMLQGGGDVSEVTTASQQAQSGKLLVVSNELKQKYNNATLDGSVAMVEMTDEHVKRFNQYLLRHAEHSVRGTHSGFMPLARVASVNAIGI